MRRQKGLLMTLPNVQLVGPLIGVLLGILIGSTASAATELDALLEALAARSGSPLAFTETRRSALLDEPIEVSGTLRQDGDGALVRVTETPRESTQTLTEEHVEIRRPDGYRQRFSLDRAPELRVLRQALGALLDGNRSALERHFEVRFEASGSADEPGWSLRLVPQDGPGSERVTGLELSGEGDQLASLVVRLSDGEALHTRFEPNP